ncbi:unnamed protein product [Closterium sp. NIES-65]|nr:unnamed protein product [Closterium sp. NIES-65]
MEGSFFPILHSRGGYYRAQRLLSRQHRPLIQQQRKLMQEDGAFHVPCAAVLCVMLAVTTAAAEPAHGYSAAVGSQEHSAMAAAHEGGYWHSMGMASRSAKCPGIIIDYRILSLTPIPFAGAPAFRFTSKVALSNVGPRPLRKWALSFGYVNQEAIGEVDGAVVPAGVQLPVAGNGLELSSPPGAAFLLTAVQSGGQKRRFQHVIQLAGTEVAATSAAAALPRTISLDATGFTCSDTPMVSGRNDTLRVCCPSTGPSQETQVRSTMAPLPLPTLPISSQGLQIQWDVLSANASQYTVAVRVSNTQRYTAVSSNPGWSLQWAWQMGEMILECDGCQTLRQGGCTSCPACLLTPFETPQHSPMYTDSLFPDCTSCPACIDNPSITNPYSCDPIPTIVDGSPHVSLESLLAPVLLLPSFLLYPFPFPSSPASASPLLPFFLHFLSLLPVICFPNPRHPSLNGSLSAAAYDNSASTTFTMLLAKAQQYWDPSLLTFPANFTAQVSNQSQGFACDPPAALSPAALETVVGGRQTMNAKAFFNTSLAPSPSCACGCSSSNTSQGGGQCDAATSTSADPAATVLLGEDLAGLVVPGQSEGSCGTGCGIQAHVTVSDADETGWTMRVALWNSAQPTIKNWTAVLAFPQGFAENLQEASSVVAQFDSPPYGDNLMISGEPSVNQWLLGDGGNVQWTLRFNRTPNTAGFNATGGDTVAISSSVFPLAVLVGGQQCQMPAFLPTAKAAGTGGSRGGAVWWSVAVAVAVAVWALLC